MKVYGVLPCATIFIALYSKMDQMFGDNKAGLFYATCLPFFAFFAVFDRVIYPNKDLLQPDLATVVSFLGSEGVVSKIIANWTSALFYIISELYSSVSIGILFWGYANSVVHVDQARRFYPLFGQMSSLGPIAAGQYVVHYASKAGDFQGSLDRLTAIITASGLGICAFHFMSERFLSSSPGSSPPPTGPEGCQAQNEHVRVLRLPRLLPLPPPPRHPGGGVRAQHKLHGDHMEEPGKEAVP
jgi:AAA family ATP:ADP antiporter